jgi:hypothetical protein
MLRSSALNGPVRACTVVPPTEAGSTQPKCFDGVATDAATDVLFTVDLKPPGGELLYFDFLDPVAPVLFAPQQPIVGDLLLWAPAGTTPPSTLGSAAAARGGEAPDFVNYGTVEVIVADCDGGIADGNNPSQRTTIKAGSGSKAYYGGQAGPTGGGIAWFVNVPPGSTTISFFVDGNPQQTSGNVPIRAGTTTVVTFNYPQWL